MTTTMATGTVTRSASTGSTGLRHSLIRVLTAARPLLLSLTAPPPPARTAYRTRLAATGDPDRPGIPAWQRPIPDRDRIEVPAPDRVARTTGLVTGHHCAFRHQSSARRGAVR
ncbi:hypothetical protein GLX30_01270 [Streptomyces sp. Tu 2975]|uniref:hypothetical protein n=1 Tax=Streptomyces sp. Tu 2975 TaxID=2676871 RepID=UPI001359F183|nr:hypothetical protein [Streptomyces sp. Tu 2975]QIP82935.1 hypothetical protein GLX30_01270 [Streptomyces sp. Tu 2975]